MPSITACHVIAKGNQRQAQNIAHDILENGLEVRNSFFGTAAWAYNINMVPIEFEFSPMVVFDVDKKYVEQFSAPLPRAPKYSFIKLRGPLHSYIPVKVLGFRNVSGQKDYPGKIGFI